MTVSTTSATISYAGDGASVTFAVPFQFHGLAVYAVTATSATLLTLAVHYSVTGGNGSTGSVVAVTAPAVGTSWRIFRVTPQTQTTAVSDAGPFPAAAFELAYDKLTMMAQEAWEKASRAMSPPPYETTSMELPRASTRANKMPVFDSSGNITVANIPGAGTSLTGDASLATVTATDTTTSRSLAERFLDIVSVRDFGAAGDGETGSVDDTNAFALAGAHSVSTGAAIVVPVGDYVVDSDQDTTGSFVVDVGATISKQTIAASEGTGGGSLTFNKSRLTAAELYGAEQTETFGAAYGRNILQNPYFAVWPDLDVFGGSSVAVNSPTMGDAATYSGTGGVRVYGPAGWWGKIWGGARDAADLATYPGAGTMTLERIRYGTTGTVGETPYFLRWTLTGFNATAGNYQDPVLPSGMDYGTNSVEIAQVIRGARRTGKFTFRMRARWRSGDTSINVRLVYNFGTGGSPSPSAQVNMQGFTLDTDGEVHDYICMFEVPEFTVDANGDAIVFGTNDTDYCILTITSGDNSDFSYDIFAVELRPGWGFAPFEYRPMQLEKLRSQEDYRILKVGYFGPTTASASAGQVVTYQPPMRQSPTIAFHDVVFNAGSAFRMGVLGITLTSPGWGYTSAPTVTITGGGGSGATATAALGVVSFAKVTNGGTGFTSAPAVVFSGGGGSGAAGTAVLIGGVVAYILMTNIGTGYTSAPTVSFSGGGGSGAAATAYLGIESITVTAAGSVYTSVPTVAFSSGGGAGASGVAILDTSAASGDVTGFLFGVLAAATATSSRFVGRAIANGRRVT